MDPILSEPWHPMLADTPEAWAEYVARRLQVERSRDARIAQEGICVRRAPTSLVLGTSADGGLLAESGVTRGEHARRIAASAPRGESA